jgi:hypothetical protein
MDEPCVNCGKPRRSCVGKCCAECIHRHTVPAKETRSFAPATTAGDLLEQQTERDGAIANFLAQLTPDERFVFDHRRGEMRHELVRREIIAGDAAYYLQRGYMLVARSTIERNGVQLNVVVVEGYEEFEAAPLSYRELAEKRGCSISYINKVVVALNRKLAVLRF